MGNAKRPLTGRLVIDWVDGSDPDNPAAEPSFGWSIRVDPQVDDEYLSALLREIADRL